MSHSIDFCRRVVSDKNRSSLYDRNWNNAYEMESESIFDGYLNGIRKIRISHNNDYYLDIYLRFVPDAEFQYFTSESCIHDGTLLFTLEIMERCVQKVVCGRTYYSPMGEPPVGAEVHFTIGNFVVLNEYDKSGDVFAPKDKKWMSERTTILLPLRVEYKTNI